MHPGFMARFHYPSKVGFSEYAVNMSPKNEVGISDREVEAISTTLTSEFSMAVHFIITPFVSDLVCLLCHSKVVVLCNIYLKIC